MAKSELIKIEFNPIYFLREKPKRKKKQRRKRKKTK